MGYFVEHAHEFSIVFLMETLEYPVQIPVVTFPEHCR